MEPVLIDYLLIAAFAIAYPTYGAWMFKRRKAQLAAGKTRIRQRTHFEAMAWLLVFTAAVASLWALRGRNVAELGVRPLTGGPGFWIALPVTAIILAFFVIQWRTVHRSEDARRMVRNALGPLRPILPHTTSEMKSFLALSLTAGLCEELLFRGYLIWVLSFSLAVWPAAIVSSLLFGYGHLYQSVGGMVKTAAVGFVAASLYIVSGSIWLPMLMHALLDAVQGGMAFDVLRDADPVAAQAS